MLDNASSSEQPRAALHSRQPPHIPPPRDAHETTVPLSRIHEHTSEVKHTVCASGVCNKCNTYGVSRPRLALRDDRSFGTPRDPAGDPEAPCWRVNSKGAKDRTSSLDVTFRLSNVYLSRQRIVIVFVNLADGEGGYSHSPVQNWRLMFRILQVKYTIHSSTDGYCNTPSLSSYIKRR
jgi:hypothetical protein